MADSELLGNESLHQHQQQHCRHPSPQHLPLHQQQPHQAIISMTDTNQHTGLAHLSSYPVVIGATTPFRNNQQTDETFDSIRSPSKNMTIDLTKPVKTGSHVLVSPIIQTAIDPSVSPSVLTRSGAYSPIPAVIGPSVSAPSPKTSVHLLHSFFQASNPLTHGATARPLHGPVLSSATAPPPSVGGCLAAQSISMIPAAPVAAETSFTDTTDATVVNVVSATPAGQESLFEQVYKLNQRLQTLESENTLLHNQLREQRTNVQFKLSEFQNRLDQPSPIPEPILHAPHLSKSLEHGQQSPKNAQIRERSHSLSPSVAGAGLRDVIESSVRKQDGPTTVVVEMGVVDLTANETSQKKKQKHVLSVESEKDSSVPVDEDAVDDEELISIISEDSERNKESTI